MHDIIVRYITVGKHHFIHIEFRDQSGELVFIKYGNATWIQITGKLRRIDPLINIGNLCCRKTHHLYLRVVFVNCIEVMEIAAGRAHNQDLSSIHKCQLFPIVM